MRRWSIIVVATLAVVAAFSHWPTAAAPANGPNPTPPAPTYTPGPPQPKPPCAPAPRVPEGALIELRMAFPATWAGLGIPWQALWTVVQWQDDRGRWQDVNGWQGNLDAVVGGEGRKTWWLPNSLRGKGPFRWQVYQVEGGRLLATSEPFDMPAAAGRKMTVELSLPGW